MFVSVVVVVVVVVVVIVGVAGLLYPVVSVFGGT